MSETAPPDSNASQYVTPGQVLVFERDSGRAVDASLLERLERAGREHESVMSITRCRESGRCFCGDVHHSHSLDHRALSDGLTERGANLLFCAAGPAFVEAGILDLDGEVVA